jgi:hypothetical protein
MLHFYFGLLPRSENPNGAKLKAGGDDLINRLRKKMSMMASAAGLKSKIFG